MNYLDQLDDYLEGRLSEADQAELEQDPAFLEALQEWELVQQSLLSSTGAEQLRTTTQSLFAERRQRKKHLRWAIAASMLLAIASSIFLYLRPDTDLFQRHYQPLHQAIVLRAPDNGQAQAAPYQAIDKAYQMERYDLALQLLEDENLNQNNFYFFRLAELYLLNYQADAALKASQGMSDEHQAMRLWIQGWAYWQLDQSETAHQVWERLSQMDHPLGQQANDLLLLVKE